MMRSMFSCVSGLKAHQTQMDVIGNNIANVNTVGFKASRSTFQEVFSQTLAGASAPDSATGRGGANPLQIGLGANIAAIDVAMTRGSIQRTDSPTDLSIEGDGFFVVRSGSSGEWNFSRAGNFTVDKQGNLVMSSGENVYGWIKEIPNPDTTAPNPVIIDTSVDTQPVNLYYDSASSINKRILAAKSTTLATMTGSLDSRSPVVAATDPAQFTAPITVYDGLGNAHKVDVKFRKITPAVSPGSTWSWTIGGSGTTPTVGTGGTSTGTLNFNPDGTLVVAATNKPAVDFTPVDTSTGTFTATIDFSMLTTYATDNSVKPLSVDGYKPGTLVNFSIGGDGIITGVYDNGQTKPLGQLAMATFANPAGLTKVGANLFAESPNSGTYAQPIKAGTNGAGTLLAGTLEMSNVDLAKQFTDMIVTQRGFQANSRVMTTSDEILQELSNMKR